MHIRRILILGASGAGKSTLARIVADRLAIPLIHLDPEFWLPGYIKPDANEWHDKVRRISAADCWVIDGNYLDTIECRLVRADALIWLDLPRWLYMTRLLRRKIRHYGRERADLGRGLPERFNLAHIRRAFVYPRMGHLRLKCAVELARAADKQIHHLRGRSEVNRFVRDLPSSLYKKAPRTVSGGA